MRIIAFFDVSTVQALQVVQICGNGRARVGMIPEVGFPECGKFDTTPSSHTFF